MVAFYGNFSINKTSRAISTSDPLDQSHTSDLVFKWANLITIRLLKWFFKSWFIIRMHRNSSTGDNMQKKSINTCYPQKTLAFQPHTTDIWSCCKIEFWSVMLPMWGFYVLWRREEIFKIFQGTAPLPDKALFGSGSTLCKYRTWLRVENLTFQHLKVIFLLKIGSLEK